MSFRLLLPLCLTVGCGSGKQDTTQTPSSTEPSTFSGYSSWEYTSGFTFGPSPPQYTTWSYTYVTCFTADTAVRVPGGERAIADLDIGDPVIAWDAVADRPVTRRVTALHRRIADEIVTLDLDGWSIETTREHPFYLLDQGEWIDAGDLVPTDRLARLVGGQLEPVVVRAVRRDRAPTEVYNLTVGGPEHTYFAGSVLVHNKTSTGTGTNSTWGTPNTAQVRVAHLAWDAGNVDVLTDGAQFVNLDPGGVSDAQPSMGLSYGPVPVTTGTDVSFELRDPIGTPLFSGLQSLADQHSYTVVAMGDTLAPGSITWPAMVVAVDDEAQAGPAPPLGHQVTVWHAMSDARVFDVWLCAGIDADGDGVVDPCVTTGPPNHAGLAFGQWSPAYDVAAASQVVTLAEAGQTAPVVSFGFSGPGQDWSYLYLISDPADPTGPPIAQQHLLGQPLTGVPPL